MGNKLADTPTSEAKMERNDSTSKLVTVRNIDANMLNFKYVLIALLVALISSFAGPYLFQH